MSTTTQLIWRTSPLSWESYQKACVLDEDSQCFTLQMVRPGSVNLGVAAMLTCLPGRLREPVTVRSNFTFENTIASMQVEEKEMFISFVKRMICWKPEDRSPARELLKDPWLHSEFPEE